MQDKIIILDFGSQYTQLIARKVRELNVYCDIVPFNKLPEPEPNIKGIILSGSPFSVKDKNAPKADLKKVIGKIPVLGICYGAQSLVEFNGGHVAASMHREYGRAKLNISRTDNQLLQDVLSNTRIWMSHGDTIKELPGEYTVTAKTEDVDIAAFECNERKIYGIQFHPEVYHTQEGLKVLHNFVVGISGCKQAWTPLSFVESTISEIKNRVGQEKVVLGLSGGVDSSVAAVLLHKAIGKNLTCIFVDNGLLRKNEFKEVILSYKHMGLNVIGVDAGKNFLDALKGVSDPEQKRKIIGKNFIDIFDREAKKIEGVKWLAQGTIYPDVIESVSVNGPSVTIKSHHNVGGLPEKMNLQLIEPLNLLFKDEVRKVGRTIGIPDAILNRHPFPGPGLGIRIIGDITPEKVRILQDADDLFVRGLIENGLYDKVWQSAVILLSIQSVGVMGDERTYEDVVALRAVTSTDGMTADWADLPHDFLRSISNKIINNVKGINRVVYDISSKPPATIEWE
jgi:GMP synthase (glutamine-hydrolysing)